MAQTSFPSGTLAAIRDTKYFYLRAGAEHRFTAVWVVVVDGRVLVRPWNDRPTGWYREFLTSKRGAVKVGDREIAVRAAPIRAKALLDAMDAGYAAKYTTKPNRQYVEGFANAQRRATTLELIPS